MLRQVWSSNLAWNHQVFALPMAVVSACLILFPLTACGQRAPEESGLRAVEAKIDGLTCPACEPPLTASLRRHFDKAVAIYADDETDTATVRFAPGQEFSDTAFREAAAEVRMSVIGFRVQACGHVEAKGNERWLVAGNHRYLVRGDRDVPVDQPVCVTGSLETRHDPPTLEVFGFELQRDSSGS